MTEPMGGQRRPFYPRIALRFVMNLKEAWQAVSIQYEYSVLRYAYLKDHYSPEQIKKL